MTLISDAEKAVESIAGVNGRRGKRLFHGPPVNVFCRAAYFRIRSAPPIQARAQDQF